MQVPDIFETEKYQPMKTFLISFAKNWKVCHFTVNGHISFKFSGKFTFSWQLSEIDTLLLKLLLEIHTLELFSYALN